MIWLLGLGVVVALAWAVSTPASRAAARARWPNVWLWSTLLTLGLIGLLAVSWYSVPECVRNAPRDSFTGEIIQPDC